MNKLLAVLLPAICLLAGIAQAEIPLNLEATIAMSGVGDLQCWLNSSSYGYAYLDQRTIFYRFQLNDSLLSYGIENDTISNMWDLRLVRMGEGGANLGVIVLWHGPVHSSEEGLEHSDYASFFDLTERSLIRTVSVLSGYENDSECYHYDGTISNWSIWPGPPLLTEFLILGSIRNSGTYCASMSGYEEDRDYINFLHVADTVFWQSGTLGRAFSFFPSMDSLRVVSSGRYELRCWGPESPCYSSVHSQVYAFVFGRTALQDYLLCQMSSGNCPFTPVVAQQGVSGARRIVTANGSAFDFETMDSLWGGAFSTAHEFVSMRVDSSNEERILIANNSYCDVYDGATGEPLGRTTTIQGDTAYVLKQPMRADRLVTRSGNTYRIYRPAYVADEITAHDLPFAKSFSLAQNYPNPFNPTTEIRFDLPVAAQVKLSIFNLLGQKVVTLMDAWNPAGTHRAEWNGKDAAGRDVSSGVYVYHLSAGKFQASRKMILMR